VVFFDPYPHLFGGGQAVTCSLAAELRRRGVPVSVMTTAEGELLRRAKAAGIPCEVLELPPALSVFGHRAAVPGAPAVAALAVIPLAWRRIAEVLRRRPSIFHVSDLRGILLAGPPAKLNGVPVVWHLHSLEPQPALNVLGAHLAAAVLTPSKSALGALPAPARRRARVVPSCPPAWLLDLPPARFEIPLVVSAARLSPEKGLDVLVEATALLREQVPGAAVQVFGAPQLGWEAYRRRLERRALELGLGSSFELLGHVEEPARGWGRACVYVQPSRQETMGLAALEAMAVGLPVVASAVGGLTEVVDHGETGLLVPPGEPRALAAALGWLLARPADARRMGEAGRQRVVERFASTEAVEQLLGLYGELR
jgi:glycosyltransferase involved in cell wall biosynthesis